MTTFGDGKLGNDEFRDGKLGNDEFGNGKLGNDRVERHCWAQPGNL